MSIPIRKCREILSKTAGSMTDIEIEQLKNVFILLSDVAFDSFLTKRNNSKSEKKMNNKKAIKQI